MSSPPSTSGSNQHPSRVLTPDDKNPVRLLNELRPGLQYVLENEEGRPHSRTFTMSVSVDGVRFQAVGSSKRLSKLAVSKTVLSRLYNFSFVEHAAVQITDHMTFPQPVADAISRLVNERFEQLTSSHPLYNRRKVLAGIVMSCGQPLEDNLTLISLATGTKCINGDHLSDQGLSINDCHAEVMSRRCLIEYLYSQLMILKSSASASDSIFEMRPEGRGYRMKERVQFHLYVSTAPCGDARIFSPHEASTSDTHPNRSARGQLRTKVEAGQGFIPVKSQGIQTWDGIIQGQRLLTMTCSDKIARWAVVGVQGALLSIFIEPIYLSSVVLGSVFHPSHLTRAIGGRIKGDIKELPALYELHTPLVAATSCPEQRKAGKAPNECANWTIGQECAEVVNAITGRADDGFSRLCKRTMFKRFHDLEPLIPIESLPPVMPSQYRQAKNLSSSYSTALHCLQKAFVSADLGRWIGKPVEQDMFEINM